MFALSSEEGVGIVLRCISNYEITRAHFQENEVHKGFTFTKPQENFNFLAVAYVLILVTKITNND